MSTTKRRHRLDFPPRANDTASLCNARSLPLTDGTTSRVSLTLDSTLASVETVEETALGFARTAGFDLDMAGHLAMVAREAAANAIVHGNKFDTARQIIATFELTPADLIVTVADQGAGLDPDTIPDPLAPENLLRSSGRGVFLMRTFMDQVTFRNLNPGTEITLTKHRP